MSTQNRATLKGYFNTGDTPTEANYADVIDSKLNIIDATTQTVASALILVGSVTASTGILSNANVNIHGDLITTLTGSFATVQITDKLAGTGPQQLTVNPDTSDVSSNSTLSIANHHAKYVLVTGTTTVTLPPVGIGACIVIVNNNANGTAITVDPDGADKFLYDISGTVGIDGKYIQNSAGTSLKGDFVKLIGLSADGWAITEKSGVWTDEA